jgi:CRP-like cAMP-binding protein
MMQEVTYPSGETLFRAQEMGSHLFIIGSGTVDICSRGPDGVTKVQSCLVLARMLSIGQVLEDVA